MLGSSRKMAAAAAAANSPSRSSAGKELFILRHGQATHNPRAEAAREQGCSHEEFLEWMRKDDSLDAELTELGRSQAKAVLAQHGQKLEERLQLCVSSPLSRALQTADATVPFVEQRLCVEAFREINGEFLNAKRKPVPELKQRFSSWDFSPLTTQEDTLWTPELETQADCAERGYQGLCWILERPEDSIFLVCHGGILRFAMNQHEQIKVVDGRAASETEELRDVCGRFGNCELRRYSIAWESKNDDTTDSTAATPTRRTFVLTELDQV